MDRVEGEETRRVIMGSQSIGNPETKAMAVTKPYPNPISGVKGDQINPNRYEFYKKEDHRKEEFLWSPPKPQTKGWLQGWFQGRKSPTGERNGQHRENR
jgi:hypothetical protein